MLTKKYKNTIASNFNTYLPFLYLRGDVYNQASI
jgi:hypothetical protein